MGGIVSPEVSGIVLCGGLSRRMGRSKPWLPWALPGGSTLLEQVVETLRPLVKEIILVGRAGQVLPEIPAVRQVTDRIPGAGPLGGLEAGLAAIRTPSGLLVGCDMPRLNAPLLKAMIPLARGCDLVILRVSGRIQPLHALYAKRIQPVVGLLLGRGERRLQALAGRVKTRLLEEDFIRAYDPLCRSVESLDTQEAYQQAYREAKNER